jgi:hypothetical protein
MSSPCSFSLVCDSAHRGPVRLEEQKSGERSNYQVVCLLSVSLRQESLLLVLWMGGVLQCGSEESGR